MGRSIYCDGEFVWKYAFGAQSSEQYRIFEELGIGEYEGVTYTNAKEEYSEEEFQEGIEEGWIDEEGMIENNEDLLILNQSDVPLLEKYLQKKHLERLKIRWSGLHKEYQGASVHLKGESPLELYQNHTLDEVEKRDDIDFLGIGISVGSPLDNVLKIFAGKYDFYFLSMIERMVEFMKKNPEQDVFEFYGEL